MNKIKGNLNWIIGIVVVLFVGFFVYNSFFKADQELGVKEIRVSDVDVETRKIIEVLDQIDKINIDAKFFNQVPSKEGYSLIFRQLEDFSQPIPKKKTRKNKSICDWWWNWSRKWGIFKWWRKW